MSAAQASAAVIWRIMIPPCRGGMRNRVSLRVLAGVYGSAGNLQL